MNIAKLLKERELHPVQARAAIENSLEDAFIAGNAKQFDNPLPRSVSSTIAIAMSCNGQTFATTHGDHTVKIFDFLTGAQIRVFSGHPRTPWTIKYHPTDPNIVASGCLGFEVRVWDIAANACITMTTFTQTIISLAFHPKGHFIAVACGMHIELWDWNNCDENGLTPMARAAQRKAGTESGETEDNADNDSDDIFIDVGSSHGSNDNANNTNDEDNEAAGDGDGEYPPHWRSITHTRNIRAVLFHPSGDYIFAVAPEAPKQSNDELAHCRLYACEFSALLNVDSVNQWGEVRGAIPGNQAPYYQEDPLTTEEIELAEGEEVILPLRLSSCRVLIPQIHLYSDGGIDISKDGKYLFTCARVHYPPALQEFAYGNPRKGTFGNLFGTFSPNSHPARLVADERESKLRASGSGFSSVLSRGHPKSSEFEMPRPGGRLSYLRFPTSSSSSSSPSSSEVPNSAPSTQGKSSLHDSAPPPPLFLPRNLRIENDNIAAPPPPAVILGMSTPPPTAPRMPTSARTPNSGNSTAGSSSSTTQQQRHPPQQASPNVPGTAPGSAFSVPPRSSSNNSSSAYPAGDSVLGDDKDGGGLSLQEHLLHQLSLKDPVVSSTIDGVPVVVNMSTSATSVLKGSKSTAAAGAGAASVSETSPLCGEKKAGMSPMVDSKELNGADPSDLFAPTEGKLGSFGANVCEARLSAPYPRQKLMQLCDKTPPGWLYEDHMCLFDLSFAPSGSINKPRLINSKLLPGGLMKAVTSTKLSATCRYALIGYGVRIGGVVQDHCRRHAACEVISIQDEAMQSMTVMSDLEDEVNIAQFHPFAGHGIVYGTKRGKIRTFSKT